MSEKPKIILADPPYLRIPDDKLPTFIVGPGLVFDVDGTELDCSTGGYAAPPLRDFEMKASGFSVGGAWDLLYRQQPLLMEYSPGPPKLRLHHHGDRIAKAYRRAVEEHGVDRAMSLFEKAPAHRKRRQSRGALVPPWFADQFIRVFRAKVTLQPTDDPSTFKLELAP